MEAPLMQVGGVDKVAIDASAEAIIKVATCSPIPEVVIKALNVLEHLTATSNVSVSGCTFTGGDPAVKIDVPSTGANVKYDYEGVE